MWQNQTCFMLKTDIINSNLNRKHNSEYYIYYETYAEYEVLLICCFITEKKIYLIFLYLKICLLFYFKIKNIYILRYMKTSFFSLFIDPNKHWYIILTNMITIMIIFGEYIIFYVLATCDRIKCRLVYKQILTKCQTVFELVH